MSHDIMNWNKFDSKSFISPSSDPEAVISFTVLLQGGDEEGEEGGEEGGEKGGIERGRGFTNWDININITWSFHSLAAHRKVFVSGLSGRRGDTTSYFGPTRPLSKWMETEPELHIQWVKELHE